MSENSVESEAVLKDLHRRVTAEFNRIKESETELLSDEERLTELKKLKVSFTAYNLCFSESIEIFPDFKKALYERQRDVLKNNCVKVVEGLGFSFETDFGLGLDLEEDPFCSFSEDDTLKLNKTQSLQNLHSSTLTKHAKNLPPLSGEKQELNLSIPLPENNLIAMAKFNRKEANGLITEFNGTHEALTTFIRRCKSLHDDYENETEKKRFLDFVINFKLSSAVLNKFGTEKIPTTFTEFEKAMVQRFSDKTTEVSKLAELEKILQTDKLTDFCTRLETMSAELVELKLKTYTEAEKDSARPFIKKEVDKLAVRQLIAGLKRPEVQQAVVFKDSATLSDAIAAALQADAKFAKPTEEFELNAIRSQGSRNYNQYGYQRNQEGSDRNRSERWNDYHQSQNRNGYRNSIPNNQANYGNRYFYNQNRNYSNGSGGYNNPRYNERYNLGNSSRTNLTGGQVNRNQNEHGGNQKYPTNRNFNHQRTRNQNVRNFDHFDDGASYSESQLDQQNEWVEDGYEMNQRDTVDHQQNHEKPSCPLQTQGNYICPQQINRVVARLRDLRH